MQRSNHRAGCTLGFAVCATLLAQPAWAGRPFTTEDAGVIAARDCELEIAASHVRPLGQPSERGLQGQVGCGIGFDTQLAWGAGRFRSGDGSVTTTALVGKTALRPFTGDGFGLALAYTLEGSRTSGRPWRHASSAAAIVLSIPHGRTITHANLGLSRNHLDRGTTGTYALAVEWLGAQGVDVGVEMFGEGRESPWVGTGARYAIVADELWVDFSLAVQTGNARTRQLTAGLKFAF